MAVRRHAGDAGLIQRCQAHKKRNVVDHLPEEHKADVKRKLQNAYSMTEYGDAKRALDRLHRELVDINPSAARVLKKGWRSSCRTQVARAGTASSHPGQHERHRIGFLDCRYGLPQCEALQTGNNEDADSHHLTTNF